MLPVLPALSALVLAGLTAALGFGGLITASCHPQGPGAHLSAPRFFGAGLACLLAVVLLLVPAADHPRRPLAAVRDTVLAGVTVALGFADHADARILAARGLTRRPGHRHRSRRLPG